MAKAKAKATAMARAQVQRGFEQRDFTRTGTISDADWSTTRTFSFSDRRQIAIVLNTYREALNKGIPGAQARLQMQIKMSRLREERLLF